MEFALPYKRELVEVKVQYNEQLAHTNNLQKTIELLHQDQQRSDKIHKVFITFGIQFVCLYGQYIVSNRKHAIGNKFGARS